MTYDIASLMRDAFISWDEAFVLDVTIRYWEKARKVESLCRTISGLSIEAWNSWVSSGILRCLASLRVSTIETESQVLGRYPAFY